MKTSRCPRIGVESFVMLVCIDVESLHNLTIEVERERESDGEGSDTFALAGSPCLIIGVPASSPSVLVFRCPSVLVSRCRQCPGVTMPPAGCIWRNSAGAELWVGGKEDAADGLRGRAKLIINCANVDYDFLKGTRRFVCRVMFWSSGAPEHRRAAARAVGFSGVL